MILEIDAIRVNDKITTRSSLSTCTQSKGPTGAGRLKPEQAVAVVYTYRRDSKF